MVVFVQVFKTQVGINIDSFSDDYWKFSKQLSQISLCQLVYLGIEIKKKSMDTNFVQYSLQIGNM